MFSCNKEDTKSNCNSLVCDQSLAMISFRFTDKDGNGLNVKNYSAINQKTGDTIKSVAAISINVTRGTYIIIDDAYKNNLSSEGNDIKISGTNESTGQTKVAVIKVAGGSCNCHVSKLSGPDKITFD